MPDNNTLQAAAPATLPAGLAVAFRSVTYSGDAAEAIAPVGLVAFSGSDDAKTATDVPGGGGVEAAALRVTLATDCTGQVKLAAGSAVIGHVIVDTAPSTAVTGPLTDTQLRATAVPVSLASQPLPTGAATEAGHLATIDTVLAIPTGIFNGVKNVTTAGTRVTLASTQAVKSVTIKAKAANTGTIYVGNTGVTSANGFALLAGESISMDIADLATVNLDASVNGEGVTYLGVA